MKRANTFIATLLVWMIVSPSLGLLIDTEASGSIVTSITDDSGDFISSNELRVRDSTNISFSVSAVSTSFNQGYFSYSGIINGNGTYNASNTILRLNSSTTGNITLNYFASGSTFNETNKTLNIVFDTDAPTYSLSTINNSMTTSISSTQSNITIAGNGNVLVTCNDQINSIKSIQILSNTGNSLINATNTTTAIISGNLFPSNGMHTTYLICVDSFDNRMNSTLLIQMDDQPPQLNIYPSQTLTPNQCVSPLWTVSVTSTDNSQPTRNVFSTDNGITWSNLYSPFRPSLNFSGNLNISAIDGVGNRNYSSLSIYKFDQSAPTIYINETSENYSISFQDDCTTISSGLYQIEYGNGSKSNWISVNNNSIVPKLQPSSNFRYRINVKANDNFNQTSTTNSSWSVQRTVVNFDTSRGMVNVGNYVGDSIRFTATPPVGGSFQAIMQHSTGNITGSFAIEPTSTVSWGFNNISSGRVWLNVTTTDAYGRTAVDVYTYLVDSEVTSTPILTATGTRISLNGTNYLGANGRIALTNLVDSGGVGFDEAECFWNGNTNPVTYSSTASLTPPSTTGQSTAFTLNCRIVDQVGNIGANTTYTGIVDLQTPVTTITPLAGVTITDNTTLTFTSTDAVLNGTSSAVITWTNGTNSWNTTVVYNGSWNGSLSGLNSNLGDGTVTVSLIARDWFGNQQSLTLNSWSLNTTMVRTVVNFDTSRGMVNVGNYVGDSIRFTATPPVGGSFQAIMQHSTGNITGSFAIEPTSTVSWGFNNISSGRVWLNVTTTDAYGRTAVDVYTYLVDSEVTSTPILTATGTRISLNGTNYLGANGRIALTNLVDSGGVGFDEAECFWNGNTNPVTYSSTASLTPPSTTGQSTAFTLNCRIVDQVGNIGANTTYTGIVDLQTPVTTITPLAGVTITDNTTLTFTSTDAVLNGTSSAVITWTNGTNSWNTTVVYNGSWNGSLSGLNSNLGDGTVTVSLIARDWFGNQQSLTLNSWSLNTTMVRTVVNFDTSRGMVNVGNYVGDSIRFTATPPVGGSFQAIMQHSTGNITGSFAIEPTSTVSWGFNNISSGRVWLNVTTTDAYGRTAVDVYTYLVDSEVTSTPILTATGTRISLNGTNYLGANGRIALTNLVDSGGVGFDEAECFWNGNTNPVTYSSTASLTPPSTTGQSTAFTLNCRIVDQVGNIGANTTYTGIVDLQTPVTTITPLAGVTITDNTTLTFTSTDAVLNGTSSAVITWTNGTNSWNTTVVYNGSWNGSLSGLNSNLGDGTVTVSLIARDWFGNQQSLTLNSWSLNTTMVRTVVNFDTSRGMVNVGNYVGDSIRFTATPPVGGSFQAIMQHSTGNITGSFAIEPTSTVSWGFNNISSGRVWLNVTTTDAYGRTAVDVYTYLVDSEVTSTPILTATGTRISLNGTNYLGANGRIALTNLVDSGGVGFDEAECFWNGNTNPVTYSSTASLTPPSTTGQSTAFTLNCRIVDQVGNIGANTTYTGIVDLQTPVTTITPLAGVTITDNTTLTFTSTDAVLNGTSSAVITWTNGTNSWNTTVVYNGSWNGSLSGLNSNLGDGTVTVSLIARDWFGNQQSLTLNSWSLNTTMVRTVVNFDTSRGMVNVGNYVGDSIRFTATPPVGGSFQAIMQHSTGNITGSFAIEPTSTVSWGFNNISSGRVWLNVTTTDAYGRTAVDVYTYLVDSMIATQIDYTVITQSQNIGQITYTDNQPQLRLRNLSDDPIEAGYAYAQCSFNNGSVQTVYGNLINLSGQVGVEQNNSLSCRPVDRVGNLGNWSTIEFVTDGKAPLISTSPNSGDRLGLNSSIAYTCQDTSGATTKRIEYIHSNNSSVSSGTIHLNGSQPMISQLNLFDYGGLEIKYTCSDFFGNEESLNVSGLFFTSYSPFADVVFRNGTNYLAPSGNFYVDNQTHIVINYRSNGNGNGNMSYILYKQSSVIIQDSNLTNADIDFTNYSSGDYRLEIEACSQIQCGTNQVLFTIDNEEPTTPFIRHKNNGTSVSLVNSIPVGRNNQFELSGGADNQSGISRMECTSGTTSLNLTYQARIILSPYLDSLFVDGAQQYLSCRYVDNVGNPSDWVNLSINADFSLPIPNVGVSEIQGHVFDDSELVVTCNDANPQSIAQLTVNGSYNSDFSVTVNENVTYLVGNIVGNKNMTQQIRFKVSCTDLHGNQNSSVWQSHTFIEDLGTMNVTSSYILETTTVNYIGNGTTDSESLSKLTIVPMYSIGTIQFSASLNGQLVYQSNTSATQSLVLDNGSWNSIYSGIASGSQLEFEIKHYVNGTNTTSTQNLGKFMLLDVPEVRSVSRMVLSNGSSALVTYSTSPCGNVSITSTVNQNSVTTTTDRYVTIAMPNGVTNYEIFEMTVLDCVGNEVTSVINITRDLITPQLMLLGFNNLVSSPSNKINVNITDNYPIQSVIVNVSNYSSSVTACTSNCEFFMWEITNFSHGQQGYITVYATTSTGEIFFYNQTFSVDSSVIAPVINSSNSVNTSGHYISPWSNLSIEGSEQMSEICLQIIGLTGSTCWTNQTIVNWDVPLYSSNQNVTIVLNGTDLFGNTNQRTYNLRYHKTAPSLTVDYYTLETPGYVNLSIASELPYQIVLDGTLSQVVSGSQIYANADGKHTVNATLTDEIGNTRSEQITIILDSTNPNVNLTLPASVNVGINSTISFNMQETFSNVSQFSLNISSSGVVCGLNNMINLENYSGSITVSTILSQNTCGLQQDSNYPITIEIVATNEVGRMARSSVNTSYVGSHDPAYLAGMNFIQVNSTTVFASNYSTFSCFTNHTITTNLTVTVPYGMATINTMNVVLWENNSGIVRCSYIDELGNSLDQSWNVYFKANDVIVNASYRNNAGNVSKLGGNNILYQSNSSQGIRSVEIYANGNLYQSTAIPSGLTQFNLTEGFYSIEIIATSELGYETRTFTEIYLDGSQPELLIRNSTTINYNSTINTMYVSNRNVTIDVEIFETICPSLPSISISNGQLLSINQNVATIGLSSNKSQFTIELTDCVGWKKLEQVQVIRKSTIDPATLSENVQTYTTGNTIFVDQSGSFVFASPDSLLLSLTCYTSTGTMTCTKISYNRWNISVSGISGQGQIRFELTDTIGNMRNQTYSIVEDDVSPTCTTSGIEIDDTIHLHSLSEITIFCSDSGSGLDYITVSHYSQSQTYEAANSASKAVKFYSIIFGPTLQIEAYDSVGNTYSITYQINLDNIAPEITCTSGIDGETLGNDHYINSADILSCEIIDDLAVNGNISLLARNSTNPILTTTIQGNFTFQLEAFQHGTVLEFTINVEDEFGNVNSTIITVFVDRIEPEIILEGIDRIGNLLGKKNIMHSNGTYRISVNDDSSVSSLAEIFCESGDNYAFYLTSSISISESNLNIQSCGDFFTLIVESEDAAGNMKIMQEVVEIDYLPPDLVIESSCPLGNKSITVLLPTCTLNFGGNDDTNNPIEVTVEYNGLKLSSTHSVKLNLSQFTTGEIHDITVSLIDSSNRESRQIFRFFIQPNLNIDVSESTCSQDNFDCGESPYFEYDYLVKGNVSLNVEIPPSEDYSNLVSTTGKICHVDNNIPCIDIGSYPFPFQPSNEGYWNWTYFGTDDLGRAYQTTEQLLVDLGGLQSEEHFIYPTHPARTNEVALICETCKFTVVIHNHHRPHIITNAANWILSHAGGAWTLEIETNSESISPQNTTLDLRISSAAAHSIYISTGIIYTGQISIEPTISSTKLCSDNPGFVENNNAEQHYLCLYNKNELNSDNSLEIDLGLNILSSEYIVRTEQSFMPSTINELSYGPFDSELDNVIPLEVLRDSAGQLMIYKVSIFTKFSTNPEVIFINLVNEDEFESSINPSFNDSVMISKVDIHEHGLVDLALMIEYDVSLGGVDNLNRDVYGQMLRDRFEEANCSISGTITQIDGYDLENFTLRPTEDKYDNIDCKITAILQDDVLKIYSDSNWSDFISSSESDSKYGLFYNLREIIFTIHYKSPISGSEKFLRFEQNDKSNIISMKYDSINYDPNFSGDVCDKITQDRQSSFLDTALDWGKISDCLSSMEDINGLHSVGIEFEFIKTGGLGKNTVLIMCIGQSPSKPLPSSVPDWFSSSELTKSDCSILFGELQSIDQTITYDSINIRLLSCDVHCNYADDERGKFVYFDNLTNFSTTGMEDPRVKEGLIDNSWLIIGSLLVGFVIIVVWKRYRDNLFPRKR